jgi:VWA domain-containing protein
VPKSPSRTGWHSAPSGTLHPTRIRSPFDTKTIDLTEQLDDPTDVLFSVRLGGGTDINGAVAYCQQLVRAPLRSPQPPW